MVLLYYAGVLPVLALKTRLNVIHPGPIDTALYSYLSEEQKASYVNQVVLGRVGQPEEIAATALFLASDDSSYINGISISVDGGVEGVR